MRKIDNYKAIIISGNKEDDVDGEIIYVGSLDKYDYHTDALLDFLLEKYPNVEVLKTIPRNCEPDVPTFFLMRLNNISYLNISSDQVRNRGLLFIPNEITEKQRDSLDKIAEELDDAYVDIGFDLDLDLDDGLVTFREYSHQDGYNFKKMIDSYFEAKQKGLH